jgi:hypothetical protein
MCVAHVYHIHTLCTLLQDKTHTLQHRNWKVGVAAASGGALLFWSGGLAAPSIAASLSVLGSALSYMAPSLTAWISSAAAAAAAAASGTILSGGTSTAAISSMFGATGAR